jgi:cell division protein FtsB
MVRLLLSTRLPLLTTVRLVDATIMGVMGVCRVTVLVTEITVLLSLLGTSSILARVTLALVATSLLPRLAAVVVVVSLSFCRG